MLPSDSMHAMDGLLNQRKFREALEASADDESMYGQVMHAALGQASSGYGSMQRTIEETGDKWPADGRLTNPASSLHQPKHRVRIVGA